MEPLSPEFIRDPVERKIERRRAIEQPRDSLAREPVEAPRRRIAERLAAEVDALNRCLARESEFVRATFQLPPVDIEAETQR